MYRLLSVDISDCFGSFFSRIGEKEGNRLLILDRAYDYSNKRLDVEILRNGLRGNTQTNYLIDGGERADSYARQYDIQFAVSARLLISLLCTVTSVQITAVGGKVHGKAN